MRYLSLVVGVIVLILAFYAFMEWVMLDAFFSTLVNAVSDADCKEKTPVHEGKCICPHKNKQGECTYGTVGHDGACAQCPDANLMETPWWISVLIIAFATSGVYLVVRGLRTGTPSEQSTRE